MDKKKAIKIATSTAVAAAAFVAATPAEASTYSEAVKLLENAERLAGALKWEVSVEGRADGTNARGQLYADTLTAYKNAQKAIASLGSSKRAQLNPRADQVGVIVDRAMRYYDAVSAGKKLLEAKANLEAQLKRDVVDEQTRQAYDTLNYLLRKSQEQTSLVYGKTTRETLRKLYEDPILIPRAEALFPVAVFNAKTNLEVALAQNNKEEAEKQLNNLIEWLENIPQEKYIEQFVPVAEELLEQFEEQFPEEPVEDPLAIESGLTVDLGSVAYGTPSLELPTEVELTLSNGEKVTVEVLEWENEFDGEVEGPQTLVATLNLSDLNLAEEYQNAKLAVTVNVLEAPPVEEPLSITKGLTSYLGDYPYGTQSISLPQSVTLTLSDGSTKTVAVTGWDKSFDPTLVGIQDFAGTLDLSDLNLTEEFQNAKVILTIRLLAPEEVELTIIDGLDINLGSVAYGTPSLDLPTEVELTLSNGEKATVEVLEWENEFNGEVEGAQTLVATLNLSDLNLAEEYQDAKLTVTVNVLEAPLAIESGLTVDLGSVAYGTPSLELPTEVELTLSNGETVTVEVLEWENEFDSEVEGAQTLVATLNLSDINLAEEYQNAKLTVTVNVLEAPLAIESGLTVDLGSVAYGTPSLDLPTEVELTLSNGETVTVEVLEWENEFNGNVEGPQTLVATLNLSDLNLAEEYQDAKLAVTVNVLEEPPVEEPLSITKGLISYLGDYPYGTQSISLPQSVTLTLSDGSTKTVAVTGWDKQINPTLVGTQTLFGSLDLSGLNLTEQYKDAKVQVSIRILAPVGALTIEDGLERDLGSVPFGSTSSILPETTEITLSNGTKRTVLITGWENQFDGTVVGLQTIVATLDLSGINLAEEYKNAKLSVTVNVLPQEEPEVPVTFSNIVAVQNTEKLTYYGMDWAQFSVEGTFADEQNEVTKIVLVFEGSDIEIPTVIEGNQFNYTGVTQYGTKVDVIAYSGSKIVGTTTVDITPYEVNMHVAMAKKQEFVPNYYAYRLTVGFFGGSLSEISSVKAEFENGDVVELEEDNGLYKLSENYLGASTPGDETVTIRLVSGGEEHTFYVEIE